MLIYFYTVLNATVICSSCLVADILVNIQWFPLKPAEIICQNKDLLNQNSYKSIN
jgi:hypothetical protein